MIRNYYVILLLIFFTSCENSKYYKEEKIIYDLTKEKSFFTNKKCVVLIPSYGCGSCTQDIINFSLINFEKKSIAFIFSGYDRQKSAIYRNIKNFEKGIIIDSKSQLVSQGLVENKPVVYFIKDEHIHEIIKFDDSISDEVIQRIKDSIK